MFTRRSLFQGAAAALTVPLLDPLRGVAAEVKRVRIADIESFHVRVPREGDTAFKVYDYSVSRVHTDAGVMGTSFIGCPQDVLRRVKPILVGQDLFAVDRHIARLQMFRGESGVQSWSGVEHAMWDAIGRIANRPVAKLLGGARDKLRVYRTTVWPWTPSRARNAPMIESDQSDVPYETQAQFAVRLKQAGYTGIKVRAWRPHPMDDVDMVGVMRAAVGPDFKIMLDRTAVRPGWVWDYPTALQVCRGLEKHDAYWVEEPFDGHDIYGPARLAAEVDILITGGELGKSTYEFLEFLVNKTYDIVQPDTRICGGIWMARKIAVLAESFGIPCIQHGTSSLSLAGYIQAGCAMNNCEWQEMIGEPNLPEEQWAPARKLVRTPDVFTIENGYVLLPEAPGLGLDLNEDAIQEYRVRA
ncbi:MAG TPA: mandelate racemase/muconate lactonizing enzyme family protein [Bryobacteraceae bacterium]|nr:mandelate racemase/muconate lactonizing enzyme family protein [Bryobacteraceae bacterium]